MTADKVKMGSLTTRQKVTVGVFALLVIFLIWQVKGLIGGGSSHAPAPTQSQPQQPNVAMKGGAPQTPGGTTPAPSANPQQNTPQQTAQVPQSAMTEREMQLLQLQQETEAKYIAALNELQLLKINQSIAETNKAIASAKFETVTAEKNIVNLLAPAAVPSAASYGPSLSGAPSNPQSAQQPQGMQMQAEVPYTVISVVKLQNKWNAVVGYQGSLYSVSIGDMLSPDNSKVVAIDRSGVVLEHNGLARKISLVPII